MPRSQPTAKLAKRSASPAHATSTGSGRIVSATALPAGSAIASEASRSGRVRGTCPPADPWDRAAGPLAEKGEDVAGRAGFAEYGEDVADGVVVRGGVEIGHGVGDQGDVEAVLMGLAGGRFDVDAGGDSADDDLGDAYPTRMTLTPTAS